MFPYRRMPSHITGLYLFTVTNFLILCHLALVQGDIIVVSLNTNQTVNGFDDIPAYFGGQIPDEGIKGLVVVAHPVDACTLIDPPPKDDIYAGYNWFALVRRSTCKFKNTVLNVQNAGYQAAIVHNVGSNKLEPMGADGETGVTIPAVFIGQSDGIAISKFYTYDKEKGYVLIITSDITFNLNTYLLPFAVVVGVCFLVMLLFMIIKCVKDRRKRQRHRLTPKLLKKLPVKKFKKGDQYDVCAICLEEYAEGEKLRVLPCSHTYHTKCIDPWLTGSKYTCPMCKRKVLPGAETTDTESDSDHDGGGGPAPSETTPLLANQQQRHHHHQRPSSSGSSSSSMPGPALVVPSSIFYDNIVEEENNDNDGRGGAMASSAHSSSSTAAIYESEGETSSSSPDSLPVFSGNTNFYSSGEHSVNGEALDFQPVVYCEEELPVTAVIEHPIVNGPSTSQQQQQRQPRNDRKSYPEVV